MNDQQRAAMQAVFDKANAVEIDSDECLDFEECTAMLVPLDSYNELIEAITALREALAQPQDNTARCGGCNKTVKDGWALYCVECWEKAQPQGEPVAWIDPNDKTQAQYLPHIGEKVLFCHDGVTYYGNHTGGCFRTGMGITSKDFNTWKCHWMYPPAAAIRSMK